MPPSTVSDRLTQKSVAAVPGVHKKRTFPFALFNLEISRVRHFRPFPRKHNRNLGFIATHRLRSLQAADSSLSKMIKSNPYCSFFGDNFIIEVD